MAVRQYPYHLFVYRVSESTQDNEGNWSTPVERWEKVSICREETNGAGRTINGPDGNAIVFSAMIYTPKGIAKIAEGTQVLVSETDSADGPCRIKGTILKHDVGQLHGRLWL